MRGGSKGKDLMDGLNSYRSHATAQSSVGMTCLLRPALDRGMFSLSTVQQDSNRGIQMPKEGFF